MSFSLGFSAGFFSGILFGSFFEWALHRFLMHHRIKFLAYPFERHALVHHCIFKADETYHLQRDSDKHTVPMAWWNGPVLIAVTQLPFVFVSWALGNYWILCGAFVAATLYYGAYEYLHWCMHVPRKRNVERTGIFFRLNGHHLLHHRYLNRNFNVVLPLADLCLGTLLFRSRVKFRQAVGPVPDVQPRSDHAERETKATHVWTIIQRYSASRRP